MLLKMLLFVLFSSVAAVVSAVDLPHNSKIINGVPAQDGEFPFMATLKDSTGRLICSASILTDRWILSAAHCYVLTGVSIATVGVGSNYFSNQTNLTVDYTVVHPNYNTQISLNDLLLVRTLQKITIKPGVVETINFNTVPADDLKPSRGLTAAGWGVTNYDTYALPDNLLKANISMQFPGTCWKKNNQGIFGSYYPFSPQTQLCGKTQGPNGMIDGVCYGDSGGPLFAGKKVYGVTSRLMTIPCGTFPDIFTRVSYYSSWINSVIN